MEYALEMPAGQFFAMLEASRVLRNKERVLDCYVARVSQATPDGFREIVEYFSDLETHKEAPQDFKPVVVRDTVRGDRARDAVKLALAGTRMINYGLVRMPDGR